MWDDGPVISLAYDARLLIRGLGTFQSHMACVAAAPDPELVAFATKLTPVHSDALPVQIMFGH